MTRAKEVLARHAAARLLAAACREERDLWNRHEQLHGQATTAADAFAAADPLLQIRNNCPIVAECRDWATVDEYTGIAAATVLSNGKQ